MRFNIIILISFLLFACKRDDALMKVEPTAYTIGNEKLEDRVLHVSYPSQKDSQNYYAEFRDTVEGATVRGWEFVLLDERSGQILTNLKVYRKRIQKETKEVFTVGRYYTLRGLTMDSTKALVQLETVSNNTFTSYRANQGSSNFIDVTDFSSTYYLLTFDLEGSPTVSQPNLIIRMKGRFLIRKN